MYFTKTNQFPPNPRQLPHPLLLASNTYTGWFVRLDVGLSWFAALATLLLVPSDIASSLQQQQEQHSSQPPSSSHSSSSSHLSQWWVASYWFSFISQVLILPLHMEYTRSGDFTIKDRLLASLRYNVFYYLILLAIGFGGVIVLMASGSLKPSNVVGFAIAFSNAYGLAAAIFLMGCACYAQASAHPHARQDPASAPGRGRSERRTHPLRDYRPRPLH